MKNKAPPKDLEEKISSSINKNPFLIDFFSGNVKGFEDIKVEMCIDIETGEVISEEEFLKNIKTKNNGRKSVIQKRDWKERFKRR